MTERTLIELIMAVKPAGPRQEITHSGGLTLTRTEEIADGATLTDAERIHLSECQHCAELLEDFRYVVDNPLTDPIQVDTPKVLLAFPHPRRVAGLAAASRVPLLSASITGYPLQADLYETEDGGAILEIFSDDSSLLGTCVSYRLRDTAEQDLLPGELVLQEDQNGYVAGNRTLSRDELATLRGDCIGVVLSIMGEP